jgi:hypothetical protein
VHSSLNYLTPAEFESRWFAAIKVGSRPAL